MGAYARFRSEVEERGRLLRQLSAKELLARANTPTETSRFGWSTGTISLYIKEESEGVVLVVIQGFLRFPAWSPMASVALDGFEKLADGTVREVSDDELSYFS